jgi:hypothetical protein
LFLLQQNYLLVLIRYFYLKFQLIRPRRSESFVFGTIGWKKRKKSFLISNKVAFHSFFRKPKYKKKLFFSSKSENRKVLKLKTKKNDKNKTKQTNKQTNTRITFFFTLFQPFLFCLQVSQQFSFSSHIWHFSFPSNFVSRINRFVSHKQCPGAGQCHQLFVLGFNTIQC